MAEQAPQAHPYIPNASPTVKAEMLAAIGAESIEDLLVTIPDKLRLGRPLDLPAPLTSEAALDRHMTRLLGRNRTARETVSFLGSGCYPHYVPALCDEVNTRAEFLTAYAGETYEDHGKWQALFEYTSLMAELLEMDVVNVPTYDGFQAIATSLRMAGRITGRSAVLVPDTLDAAKRAKIDNYLQGALEVRTMAHDPVTGALDPEAVRAQLADDVAAVLIETPNYRGVVETGAPAIAEHAHAAGAVVVCATDPISLGEFVPPARWGADIVCGDIQSLGLGMHFGGANGGFIASHDDERFVYEFPSRLFGLGPTRVEGEIGFVDIAYERTSLAMREEGVEWVGTAAALWGITAAVYLAQLGPQGLRELGATIAANTGYAIEALRAVPGVEIPHAARANWREFVVRYPGRDAAGVNAALFERGIFGGAPATEVFGSHGSPDEAVYCITELHTREDIDELVEALKGILA